MENIIKEWINSKSNQEFDYKRQLEKVYKNDVFRHNELAPKEILHFEANIETIQDTFEIDFIKSINLSNDDIINILDTINDYAFYLKMNEALNNFYNNNKNIKKLKNIVKNFDYDFVQFLDKYLFLDDTRISSENWLKIKENSSGAVKHYLGNDFIFSLNTLHRFISQSKKRKDGITISDSDLALNTLLKPRVKAYLQKQSPRLILKCLHYDLLDGYANITKEVSLSIISIISNIELQNTKVEHSFSKKAIDFVKSNKDNYFKVDEYYKIKFDDNRQSIEHIIPNHIKELKEIFNAKKWINDNFNFTFRKLSSTDRLSSALP